MPTTDMTTTFAQHLATALTITDGSHIPGVCSELCHDTDGHAKLTGDLQTLAWYERHGIEYGYRTTYAVAMGADWDDAIEAETDALADTLDLAAEQSSADEATYHAYDDEVEYANESEYIDA